MVFYLLNIFSYAIQRCYEKERNVFIILDTKSNIYTKLYYLKNPVKTMANYQVLAAFPDKGKHFNFVILLEKEVSSYKEVHFVEREILHLFIQKNIVFVRLTLRKLLTKSLVLYAENVALMFCSF